MPAAKLPRRAALLGGLAAAAVVRRAAAAEHRVGWLRYDTPAEGRRFLQATMQGLSENGMVAGRDLRLLERYADGQGERIPGLVADLLREGIELLIVSGAATPRAIAVLGGQIPVAYAFSGEPVAAGLAETLARPLKNATGVSLMQVELNAKRIELLKEVAPGIRRAALFSFPNHPGEPKEVEVCRRTVAELGIELLYLPVHDDAEYQAALAASKRAEVDAFVALPDNLTISNRVRVGAVALERRIPSISGWSIFPESGWLMSYGPILAQAFRRVGWYAARVLAGAKPADLPIEQPTGFELVVNVATARAIGLTLSDALVERADQLIG